MSSWSTVALNMNQSLLQWNRTCPNCGVRLLTTEKSRNGRAFCCSGMNRSTYIPLPALPDSYLEIINSTAISAKSRTLNLIFSFASMETTAKFPSHMGGFFAIQGRVYHRIRPHHALSAIRWILYDGFEIGQAPHPDLLQSLPDVWINAVRSALMTHNPFVIRLQFMSTFARNPQSTIRVDLLDEANPELVALIQFDHATQSTIVSRRISVKLHDNSIEQIKSTSRLWEPLAYPLLFPHGTPGWGCDG
jgi:hypothetical protein